jgi:outer membrane protein OmpA-like peptidoglycan-associated protein
MDWTGSGPWLRARGAAIVAAWVAAFAAFPAQNAGANVVGGDLQNFNAVPGGIDYVTVQSSETLEPGILNLSLMANHAVNSLPYYNDPATQTRVRDNDTLTTVDFGFGLGLTDSVEAGFAAQDVVAQTASQVTAHSQFTALGVTNYRFYGKLHLVGTPDLGAAVIASAVFNRVENDPFVGEGGSPVGIVELAGSGKFDDISMAVNVGYRFRKKGDQIPGDIIEPMGDQYIASVGVSYLLPWVDTKLISEIFGSRPAGGEVSGYSARQASSAEMIAGIKYDATTALSIHAGAGTELIRGVSTPDWRLYAGFNWAIGSIVTHAPPPDEHPFKPTAAPLEQRAVLRDINFATGSDAVPPEALPQLEALARQIGTVAYEHIYVEGHTDSVGSHESNQGLSERRAETVRQWLIQKTGIDQSRIEAVGYGETRPIADNGNFQGRRANRRVEVRILLREGGVQATTPSLMGPPPPPKAP